MPTEKKVTKKKPVTKKTLPVIKKSKDSVSQISSFNKLEVLSKKTRLTLAMIVGLVLIGIILFANRSLFMAGLVNGQPISRLEVIRELENQQGTNVLNRLIDRKLIIQEAEKQNISVSQEEIDSRRAEIIEQVSGGDDANFSQILAAQGLTEEQFTEELRIQLMVEKILTGDSEVTDEELAQFIESNPDLLENAENQDEARGQLREQLKQQKLQTSYNTLMESLRSNGNIVRLVDY